MAAFYDALALLESDKRSASEIDRLRRGLIELLTMEIDVAQSPDKLARQSAVTADGKRVSSGTPPLGAWSEEHSEYFAELVGSVAALDDERAIPVLLAVATSGGMAAQGVARFGTKALDAVLEQANGPDSKLAEGALFVITQMLNLRTVHDAASLSRIKNALRTALASSDPGRRDSAVYAIEFLADREEFVPMLKQLAEHDPAKLSAQPLNDGSVGDLYFVRYNAKRVLDNIARHEPLPRLPPIRR